MSELPEWPVRSNYRDSTSGDASYAEDQCEAAMARLRVTVDALEAIAECEFQSTAKAVASETLAEIGPLPEAVS